jgi:hypothetical protein
LDTALVDEELKKAEFVEYATLLSKDDSQNKLSKGDLLGSDLRPFKIQPRHVQKNLKMKEI